MIWSRKNKRTPAPKTPPPPAPTPSLFTAVAPPLSRAAPADLGNFRGKHYTGWVEVVKQLKRDKHPQVAADLLLNLLPVVEEEARFRGWGVAPWYFEQLAIIRRQQRDYAGEVEVLERYAAANAAHGGLGPELDRRLAKARALLAAQD